MANSQADTVLETAPVVTELVRDESDQLLLARFVARRDEAAFAGLVERHGRTVWGVCRRFLYREQDVEDAFQAVFLILARKAASIRRTEAVGSWLYGVAYRTAMKARRTAARRQAREQRAAKSQAPRALAAPTPSGEVAAGELQRALDEEVERLGEKYRAPFVLCCLEGMSRAEAARELGCKEATLGGRLALARKQLQGRLARRGISLSAVLTAAALMQTTATASAPKLLTAATIKGALAPSAANKEISPSADALARSLLRSMALAIVRRRLALGLALLVLFAGVSLAALQWWLGTPEAVIEPTTFVMPPVALGTPIDEQVLAVAFSTDGRRLFTAGGKQVLPGQLKIWDVAARKTLVTIDRIPGVSALALSPDGQTLVTGDWGGAIRLRDPVTGQERAQVKAHSLGVHGLAFSRDGETLASAGLDGTVKLWDPMRLEERKAFLGHTGMVFSVAFFRHGQAVVTGSRDKTAKIWDLQTGKEKFTLSGHLSGVEGVAVSPDDKLVATASRDQTVKLWDAASGKETAVAEGDEDQAFIAVAFSPDGKLLAGAAVDGTIRLWDVKTWQSVGSLEKHAAAVWALAFSPDGNYLASGSSDKTAKLWSMAGLGQEATLTTRWPAIKPILAAVYAPDGNVLAVAAKDRTLHLRDAKTGDALVIMTGHTDDVTSLAFAPDGQTLASGGLDQTVKLWDRATGKHIRTLEGNAGAVRALAFTPDGKLASAGDDKTIRLWDTALGKELFTLGGHAAAVCALAIAADGRSMASAGVERTIRTWDLLNRSESLTLKGHDGTVRALAFSSRHALASAGDDGAVKLWSPAEGKEIFTWNGHVGEVRALAFSPGGLTLVSGGQDKTVRVWDAVAGQPRAILEGHKDVVTALTIHPKGNNLVSGSYDTTLLRWRGVRTEMAPAAPVRLLNVGALGDGDADVLVFTKEFTKEPRDYYWPLKGNPENNQELSLFGPGAAEVVRFEPEGLRIDLPAGYPGQRPFTGLRAQTPIKGDFEVTVNFEVLQEPKPEDVGKEGTRLILNVVLDVGRAALARRVTASDGTLFSAYAVGAGYQAFPTTAKKGRLRVVRTGSNVSFYVAEDAADNFTLLHTIAFNDSDLRHVELVGATTSPRAALDVRFWDLRVRNGPMPPPPPVAAATERVWLIAALVLALVSGLVLAVFRRRSAKNPDPASEKAKNHRASANVPLEPATAAPTRRFKLRWLLAVGAIVIAAGLVTAFFVAFGAKAPTSSEPEAPQLKDGLVCLLVNKNSGRCLSVAEGSAHPGARIVQGPLAEQAGPSERWRLLAAGEAFRLQNEHSKLVLEIGSANLRRGVQAIQWHDFSTRANQHWTFEPMGDGFLLRAGHSQLVLGVAEGGLEEGVRVIQWRYVSGVADQVWEARSLQVPADAPRQAQLRDERYQPFRGKPESMEGLKLLGPDADKRVHFEAEGLRITLPTDFPMESPTGLTTGITVRGDFEITVNFEILKEPDPEAAGPWGTRMSLMLGEGESRGENTVKLSRGAGHPHGSRFITYWNMASGESKQSRFFPTPLKTGQLRITRGGSVLSYYASEGAGKEFTLLHQVPHFGADDLANVRIVGTTNAPEAELDFRVSELRIRAEALLTAQAADSWWDTWKVPLIVALVIALAIGLVLATRRVRSASRTRASAR
jgi:RNA polymerase sigma factor (sigma-70 family)